MPRLQMGDSGLLVERWNQFLDECALPHGNSDFDQESLKGTVAFQTLVNTKKGNTVLSVDGVVGNMTLGCGTTFTPVDHFDARLAVKLWGYTYPGTSAKAKRSLSPKEMHAAFGKIEYEHKPEPGNPERVVYTNGWENENIAYVSVPQLKNIAGGDNHDEVPFHKHAQRQFCNLWEAWEKAGVLSDVKSFEGTFSRRFKRGTEELSNHAWATAFDINYSANRLHALPATPDELGCVYRLVPLAEQYGFAWGGKFQSRLDGMHFEVTKILTDAELNEVRTQTGVSATA